MIISGQEAIQKIAERSYYNKKNIEQSDQQRRHNFVDLYGVEYTRQGDNGFPATFYISISPDMVYLERFEFKLIISPFLSGNGGGTNVAAPVIEETSLTIQNGQISPNPHSHNLTAHTHGLTPGIGSTPVTASDFRILIEGIDVTAYLMAQYGEWIDGEGVYPSIEIGKDYDILEVASDMIAEGKKDQADKLTSSGYKRVQITSAHPFSVTLVNYLKYSHMNR